MDAIKVCCAIIERDGKIMAAQRNEKKSQPLKWEFPGGKLEHDETIEYCIKRELKEELDADIDVKAKLKEIIHIYNDITIDLIPFICTLKSPTINIKEHKEILWDCPENLKHIDWAAADVEVYDEYIEYLNYHHLSKWMTSWSILLKQAFRSWPNIKNK